MMDMLSLISAMIVGFLLGLVYTDGACIDQDLQRFAGKGVAGCVVVSVVACHFQFTEMAIPCALITGVLLVVLARIKWHSLHQNTSDTAGSSQQFIREPQRVNKISRDELVAH